jgi:hypothetical protein
LSEKLFNINVKAINSASFFHKCSQFNFFPLKLRENLKKNSNRFPEKHDFSLIDLMHGPIEVLFGGSEPFPYDYKHFQAKIKKYG